MASPTLTARSRYVVRKDVTLARSEGRVLPRVSFLVVEGLVNDRVEDPKAPNRRRPYVRQQRKRDAMTVAERREDLLCVVADGRDSDSLAASLLNPAMQLHELRSAVRSPIRRPVEDQHGPVRPHDRFQGLGPSGLILKTEVRTLLPHLRA